MKLLFISEVNLLRYTKQVTDSAMIQYIVVFTLNEILKPVSSSFFVRLILKSCNINYMDLQIAIANLIDTEHMRQFYAPQNTHMYEILPLGIAASDYIKKQVPIYIREQIEEEIMPMFKADLLKNSVQARLVPLNQREYTVELNLYDGKTPLMELSFYAGTREQANHIMEHFKTQPEDVYQKILKAIVPPEHTPESE